MPEVSDDLRAPPVPEEPPAVVEPSVNRICVYSGGMDSYTLLHHMRRYIMRPMDRLYALSFNYGQRHSKELQYAMAECLRLGIMHEVIDLRMLTPFLRGSSLTEKRIPVPHGHYASESMKQTVVPGRNTIMLSLALGFAEGLDPTQRAVVYYGAHSGDHAIYPDCRPEYIAALGNTFRLASAGRIHLSAPFQHEDKGDILGRGLTMRLDYANSWTCYEGGEKPCGKCGACVERLMAFDANEAVDPLEYADRTSYRASGAPLTA